MLAGFERHGAVAERGLYPAHDLRDRADGYVGHYRVHIRDLPRLVILAGSDKHRPRFKSFAVGEHTINALTDSTES